MTKIDFYVLDHEAVQQRYLFACRLIEKAYRLGNAVFVHGSSQPQLDKLDQMLWSFRANSFLPHRYYPLAEGQPPLAEGEIILSTGLPPESYHDVMINLSNQVPDFFSRFQRVSEIVVQHEKIKQATRDNFRYYRERGYEVKTHQLAQ
ncbi:DNA polymerase III subunit chi [Dasania marina]|uniref:DNA polymerase III subunit chi n=1 Tax=Dasania marina TaxID=471499 RepID=UPI00037E77D6|nr:DNA polymerase III subunit chi [Dasania marina]